LAFLSTFSSLAREAGAIAKGVGRKLSGGGEYRKLAKKYRKIALFASSGGGGNEKKTEK